MCRTLQSFFMCLFKLPVEINFWQRPHWSPLFFWATLFLECPRCCLAMCASRSAGVTNVKEQSWHLNGGTLASRASSWWSGSRVRRMEHSLREVSWQWPLSWPLWLSVAFGLFGSALTETSVDSLTGWLVGCGRGASSGSTLKNSNRVAVYISAHLAAARQVRGAVWQQMLWFFVCFSSLCNAQIAAFSCHATPQISIAVTL